MTEDENSPLDPLREPNEVVPERIGHYHILERLGHGGMGTVYLAEQKEPVHRRVALKVVRLGMASKEVLRRFDLERQALALMNHPGIAKVFDAGTTDSGQAFFVMEHVEGIPLSEYCDKHRLSVTDRIRLFQQVCAAVQHAHQKGVIHRDLKPGNVLVQRHGERGMPKIIDFGLARATGQQLVAHTVFTEQGQMLGTPEYMSPEQATMDGEGIDTRSDIYSLGVMLYELLCGELPFSTTELRAAGLFEVQRKIREDEPQKPSTKISSAGTVADNFAQLRCTSPAALTKNMRGDLDWIVMKAMAKEAERRYGSANGLAEDLGRHLQHEPVLARPPSAGYRLRKFVRRYRVQAVTAALVLVALIMGMAGTTWQWSVATTALEQFRLTRFDLELDDAIADAESLVPAWPEIVEDLQTWLEEQGRPLAAVLDEVREVRDRLRSTTLQATAIEAAYGETGGKLEPESALEERSWQSAQPSSQFLYRTMQELVHKLEEFRDPEQGTLAEVEARLAWAKRIDDLTRAHPRARVTWTEAIAALKKADGLVASELYASDPPLALKPQLGLVPIGMNPKTLLWEFYHLRSAWDPRSRMDPAEIELPGVEDYDAEGALEVSPESGIVFVLVPGGTFVMGSPASEMRRKGEEEQHRVTLAPFFLARHELTQGQWLRLRGGDNPSTHPPGTSFQGDPVVTLAHPVESVNWSLCDRLARDYGLLLPTEAQWEYACRAGTTTPWSCGPEPDDLEGYANILDQRGAAVPRQGKSVDWDDGFAFHAPVGIFQGNGFGMHDMHGNQFEWCRDRDGSYSLPVETGDGLRQVPSESSSDRVMHILRGGSWRWPAWGARSAYRNRGLASVNFNSLGVRFSRLIMQ